MIFSVITLVKELKFQSSIAPKNDRNGKDRRLTSPSNWFQSSIAPKNDRNIAYCLTAKDFYIAFQSSIAPKNDRNSEHSASDRP